MGHVLSIVVVTSNSLFNRSPFRESSFVLAQVNYWKLQRTVKHKWSKMIFLILNLKIPIYFLLSLFVLYENEILGLWLTVNNMRPQQKLLSLFYVKKYFHIKKRRLWKLMAFWYARFSFLLRWENMLVLLNWTWYLWLLQKYSYCRLMVEICVIHLRNFVSRIEKLYSY